MPRAKHQPAIGFADLLVPACGEADAEPRLVRDAAPNLTVSVRNVPAVAAKVGFAATEPATAIMKMIGG